MWKLLAIEMMYRKNIFLSIFSVSAVAFTLTAFYYEKKWPDRNTGFYFLVYMFSCIIITAVNSPWIKEKRNRLLTPLPVSVRAIAAARSLAELVYWLMLVILFIGFGLLSGAFALNQQMLTALWAQTGIVLMCWAFACFFVDMLPPADNGDSASLLTKFTGSLLKILLPMEVFLLFIIQFIAADQCCFARPDIFYRMFQTGTGASLLFFPGLILFVLVIFIFERRKAYTGY
jgi:hypothetical protein